MTKDDRAADMQGKAREPGKAGEPGKADEARIAKRRRSDTSKAEPQIGQALRSVYDRTVNEAIPSEMLDLLGRLD